MLPQGTEFLCRTSHAVAELLTRYHVQRVHDQSAGLAVIAQHILSFIL